MCCCITKELSGGTSCYFCGFWLFLWNDVEWCDNGVVYSLSIVQKFSKNLVDFFFKSFSKWHQEVIDNSLYIKDIGDAAQEGDRIGHGDLCHGGHDDAITPLKQILGAVWDDMVNYQVREGGEVPYGTPEMVWAGGHWPLGRKGVVGSGRCGIGKGGSLSFYISLYISLSLSTTAFHGPK